MSVIEIISPDDFHHHLRDGTETLANTLQHATRQFSKVIVMPNTQPPVRTVNDAKSYRDRIVSCLPKNTPSESFTPMVRCMYFFVLFLYFAVVIYEIMCL
jgi:dihydroorotase